MDKDVPVSVWPEWELIEKIGEGSFGKVYKAKRTEREAAFFTPQSRLYPYRQVRENLIAYAQR